MTVTLYQIAPSFYSQIARLALTEKGVTWRERMINLGPRMENFDPWYMRIHPSGVVPALNDKGTTIVETIEIIRYIDEKFDGPALSPPEPSLQAKMNEWLDRFNAFPVRELSYGLLLQKPIAPLIRHTFDVRRKIIKRHMQNNPDLVAHYQARLDDIDAWLKVSSDPQQVMRLEERLQSLLANADQQLGHGGPWLMGAQYTLADVWLTVLCARLTQFWIDKKNPHAKRRLPDNVAAFYDRAKARPSFKIADLWENVRFGFMLRMVAPFMLPRLGVAILLVAALTLGILWLV